LIVYSRTDDTRQSNLDDDKRGISGVAVTRFQCISLAKDSQSFKAARRAHELLRAAVHGYRGTVSNSESPAESLYIQRIEYSGGFSDNMNVTQSRIVESVCTVFHSEQVQD
jgi:hypothetical protein